ncbi:hypothetical protein [Photobacterium indicum]|uniref:hypothetical protein n=1 Tax=Photobacterium indicum TaxID=81447 RepID=UPI003D1429AB
MPKIIKKLAKRIEAFNGDRSCLPMLQSSNGSKRFRRSESAESVVLVLKCVVKHTDLVTFKVGYYHSKVWRNLSYRRIEQQTGLSPRRVQRAMAEIQRAGLVGVHEICETTRDIHGNIKRYAKVAVKTVNSALFALFGLEEACERERKKAAKRQRDEAEQARTHAARESLPDAAQGLSGLAQAKAVMQSLKYAAKKARRKPAAPPDILEWDDGIPY